MDTKPNFQRTGIAAGLFTASCFMLYFIFMKSLDLAKVLELRSLNFFILLMGILVALHNYKKQNNNHIEYFEGLALGLLTASVAVIIFAVFIGVYLSYNSEYMEHIRTNAIMGSYLSPSSCAFVIVAEGMTSGLITSFACMQYYKKFEIGHG